MKKFLLVAAMLCAGLASQAQYYYLPFTSNPGQNPGNLNNDGEYPVGGGLPAGWTTIGHQAPHRPGVQVNQFPLHSISMVLR